MNGCTLQCQARISVDEILVHLHERGFGHRQADQQGQTAGQHLVRQDADVLGVVAKLNYVARAIVAAEQAGL